MATLSSSGRRRKRCTQTTLAKTSSDPAATTWRYSTWCSNGKKQNFQATGALRTSFKWGVWSERATSRTNLSSCANASRLITEMSRCQLLMMTFILMLGRLSQVASFTTLPNSRRSLELTDSWKVNNQQGQQLFTSTPTAVTLSSSPSGQFTTSLSSRRKSTCVMWSKSAPSGSSRSLPIFIKSRIYLATINNQRNGTRTKWNCHRWQNPQNDELLIKIN